MYPYDVSVVTATYNERGSIASLIEHLQAVFKENNLRGEIIVVDDSSPDGTADIVKEYTKSNPNIVLISRPQKSGIGSAYGDGVKASRGEVIVTMDADFSHPPDKLYDLYKPSKEGYIVSGSRYLTRLSFHTKFYRFIGTTGLNIWLRTFLRLGIKDHTNGYVAIRRDNLDKVLEKGKRIGIYPFDKVLYGVPIFTIGKHLGVPLKEVDAPYKFRTVDETKINTYDGLKIVSDSIFYSINLFLRLHFKK